MKPRGLYVYALLASAPRRRARLQPEVEIVPVAGLFAAIERMSSPPSLSEETLRRQHDIVMALAAVVDALLPVRFGAFVDNEELERIVGLRQRALRGALQRVRGHEQMTVRFFGPSASTVPSPAVVTGTDYLRQRASAARPKLTPAARAISVAVRQVVSAQVIGGPRGGVQLTLDHLVRRSRTKRYRRLLESCVEQLHTPPAISVSGPWPPFAFVPDIWAPNGQGS